jgi:acyl dehydratase
MPFDLSVIGKPGDPVERSWTSSDALIYALAVGAGHDPLTELAFTTENTGGVEQQVIPTFINWIGQGKWPNFGEYKVAGILHAEEAVEYHRAIPTEGTLRATAKIAAIYDKGSAALVVVESEAVDAATGDLLATLRRSIFIKGEGGFGGERGPTSDWEFPDRAPDLVREFQTRPEQALLFRLTGDRIRLHSDPAFAEKAGFERPILHGMCTYGFAARALIAFGCDGDAARLRTIEGRFSSTVLPGQPLSVDIWGDSTEAYFKVRSGERTVLDRGRATFKKE